MKKTFCVISIIYILVMLVSCSKNINHVPIKETKKSDATIDRVLTAVSVDLSLARYALQALSADDGFITAALSGQKAYLLKREANTGYSVSVLQNGEGADTLFAVDFDDDKLIYGAFNIACGTDNNLIVSYSSSDEATGSTSYFIDILNIDGKLEQQITLSNPDLSIDEISSDKEGWIFFVDLKTGLWRVDENGACTQLLALEAIESLCVFNNDIALLSKSTDSGTYLLTLVNPDDVKNPSFIDTSIACSYETTYSQITSNTTDALYLSDIEGIYKLDPPANSYTQLMTWSDVNITQPRAAVIFSDKQFLALTEAGTALIQETSEDHTDEPVVLTLATIMFDDDEFLRTAVSGFNKSQNAYKVKITNYATGSEDAVEAITKMNLDISSGAIPDIIDTHFFSNSMLSSYVKNNYFADLFEFFQRDGTYINDYMQNILDAMTFNGKLIGVIPSFTFYAFIGPEAVFGDKLSWTIVDLEKLTRQLDDETCITGLGSSDFLMRYCQIALEDYIDYENGTCSFEDLTFTELLEYCKSLGDKPSDAHCLIGYETFNSGRSAKLIDSFTGEKSSIIYVSGKSNSGISFNPSMQLSVMASSANKDGAWDFVKYMLTDALQDEIPSGFPVKCSSLDKFFDKCMDKNNVSNPLTQEEADYFKSVLSHLKYVQNRDSDIISMITEEAQYYFSGDKTAQEVSEIIQNRVSLYLAENA